MTLPQNIDPTEFDDVYRLQPQEWYPAVVEICALHAISLVHAQAYSEGSNLVAAVGDYVVKIFPPFHRHQWHCECSVLPLLYGRLSISTPALVASGERRDGWTYAIISRLNGDLLESVWSECTHEDRLRCMERIGEIMREAHQISAGNLISIPPEWHSFISQQQSSALSRHQRLQMPPWFLSELNDFVDENIGVLHADPNKANTDLPNSDTNDLVILTGEYTPFNLLVQGDRGSIHMEGMFDFGDAMVGAREYDFVGPILFLASGDAELVRGLLRGYGFTKTDVTAKLRRKIFLLAVLHRYSNLRFQLRIPDWEERVRSIAELEHLIWPLH